MTPLAGGTRVLAADTIVPNVVDLVGLGLFGVRVEDEDLEIGAATPLQDIVDSLPAYAATAGLLPAASRAAFPSRLLRGMATSGGEACHDDPDSELCAALLALNAVFLVTHPKEPRESPALRFLRSPAADLAGGGILRAVLVPGGVGWLPPIPSLPRSILTSSSPSGSRPRAGRTPPLGRR